MRSAIALVVGGLLLVTASLSAHHGYGAYYSPTERTIQVEGDLVSIDWTNPHVAMKVRTADGTMYVALWQAPSQLERTRVTRTTLRAGDHVVLVSAAPKDPRSRELMLIRQVTRSSDGWIWRSGAPFAQPTT